MLLPVFLFAARADLKAQCTCTPQVGSNVSIPDLSTAGAGYYSLSGGCLKVNGTFTVNNNLTWTLSGVTVYFMTSASQIIVNNGSTLNAHSASTFDGCGGGSWSGIRGLTGSTVTVDACTLSHATNAGAVSIAGAATFTITDNTFTDNGVAIKIAGTQNYLNHAVSGNYMSCTSAGTGVVITGSAIVIDENDYYYPTFSVPSQMKGVVLEQYVNNITLDDQTMINQEIGVEIKTGVASVLISDMIFGGGTGVLANNAWGALSILDGSFRARNDAIRINEHGSSSTLGNITIDRNVISSAYRSGIRIIKANGDRSVFIRDNYIQPNTGDPVAAAYAIGVTNSHSAFIQIEGNTVTHTVFPPNASIIPGGIYVQGSDGGCVIRNNVITTDYNGHMEFGINVAESNNIQVVGNNVNAGGNTMMYGIAMLDDPANLLLCCNTVDASAQGLYLLGPHENAEIFNTTFGAHGEALYYDMVVTSSAPQFHRGNDWSGASTTWDGYFNGNSFFAPFAFYTVDDSHLANISKIYVTGGDAGDWFAVEEDDEAECVNTSNSYCGEEPIEHGGEPTLTDTDVWAAKEQEDEAYATLHWSAQRHLFRKLVEDPGLLGDDEDVDDFYDIAEVGNIGKFHAVEHGLEHLWDDEPDEFELEVLLGDLLDINGSVDPDLDCEAYLQDIYDLLLTAQKNDDWDFDSGEQETIDGIANLCPQEGGPAVYLALTLQENYRVPTWNLDCEHIGDRSKLIPSAPSGGISLYPNPAQDLLWMDFGQAASAGYRIEFFDLAGRAMHSHIVAEGAIAVSIPLNSLPNGYYFARILDGEQTLSQEKITILR